MNRRSTFEVLSLGALIGVLAFGNYALYMIREGVTFSSSLEAPFPAAYLRATTIAYLTIAFCQFANVLSRRYEFSTIFNRNLFTNRILLWSIAGSIFLIFIAVYLPFVSRFLYFSGPGIVDWLYIIGAAGLFLGVFELLKMFKRTRYRRAEAAS